jgi:hypothetical protein
MLICYIFYRTHVPVAAALVLNTPDDGRLRPKHVEWVCRNKTCTVLHQVGVSFDPARYLGRSLWMLFWHITLTFRKHLDSGRWGFTVKEVPSTGFWKQLHTSSQVSSDTTQFIAITMHRIIGLKVTVHRSGWCLRLLYGQTEPHFG